MYLFSEKDFELVIKRFNTATNSLLRVGNENNRTDIQKLVSWANRRYSADLAPHDVMRLVDAFARENADYKGAELWKCFMRYAYDSIRVQNGESASGKWETLKPAEKPAEKVVEKPKQDDLSALVSAVFSPVISSTVAEQVDELLGVRLKAAVEDICGVIVREEKIISDIGEIDLKGTEHKMLMPVLKAVANNRLVYLYGEAGTGKSYLAKQVAEKLKLDYYYQSKILEEYALIGYNDANGEYVKTAFYDAFKNGGVFILDELDGSSPSAVLALNGALANREFTFPCGKVKAHKDFHVIATGNTSGMGADGKYTARAVLDRSTLDRFIAFKLDYDEKVEMMLCNNNKELVSFIHAVRKAADDNGLDMTVTYRAIENIAVMESVLDNLTLVLDCALLKGMERDDVAMLASNIKMTGNRYYEALKAAA